MKAPMSDPVRAQVETWGARALEPSKASFSSGSPVWPHSCKVTSLGRSYFIYKWG